MPLVTEAKKRWKRPLGKKENERGPRYKKRKEGREAQKKKWSLVKSNMRGGSLTRFRTDE